MMDSVTLTVDWNVLQRRLELIAAGPTQRVLAPQMVSRLRGLASTMPSADLLLEIICSGIAISDAASLELAPLDGAPTS
jgi:hypothetical protein